MRKKKLDPEMRQFQADLLQSVRDMKAGHSGRVHHFELRGAADPAIKQAWAAEAKDRLSAFQRGEIQAVPTEGLLIKMSAHERVMVSKS